VPAVGCAPEARLVTLNDSCLDPLNDLANAHNRLLNATIQNLTVQYSDATFLVGDTYGLLEEATSQPSNFGETSNNQ
jgi:phospholipase/lecithinase/hemolysin